MGDGVAGQEDGLASAGVEAGRLYPQEAARMKDAGYCRRRGRR